MEFSRLTTAAKSYKSKKHSHSPARNDKFVNYLPSYDKNNKQTETSTCEWRITYVNKDFRLCPTYAAALIVPKSINDEKLIQSAAFRDGGRFPVLSYIHENGVS